MTDNVSFLRRIAPLILGVLLILGCAQPPELPAFEREWVPVEERKPIDLSGTFKTVDGEDVPLIDSDLESKVLFLNLWATWCLPCLEEMPFMATLYQEFSDQGLAMVAVSSEDPEVVRGFLEKHPYPFKILLDPEDTLSLQLNTIALPTTFIVDRQGRIALQQLGAYHWDSPAMIEQFRQLLADD
ncbi:MAG: TlpA family protein disulfide reductase [Acidobacteria bacterium]|nr:TlpA family protein disulfide reductase [Acidobacteriota bacterium]